MVTSFTRSRHTFLREYYEKNALRHDYMADYIDWVRNFQL